MTTPDITSSSKDLKVHQAMAQVIAAKLGRRAGPAAASTLTDGTLKSTNKCRGRTVNEDKTDDGDWQKLVSIPYEMLNDD